MSMLVNTNRIPAKSDGGAGSLSNGQIADNFVSETKAGGASTRLKADLAGALQGMAPAAREDKIRDIAAQIQNNPNISEDTKKDARAALVDSAEHARSGTPFDSGYDSQGQSVASSREGDRLNAGTVRIAGDGNGAGPDGSGVVTARQSQVATTQGNIQNFQKGGFGAQGGKPDPSGIDF